MRQRKKRSSGALLNSVSDSDASAWLTAVGLTNGSTDNTVRTLVDNFIIGMKADGNWTMIDRIYLNYRNTTIAKKCMKSLNDATLTNITTVGSNGLVYNGTTQHKRIDAQLDALTNVTTNQALFMVHISVNVVGPGSEFGADAGADLFMITTSIAV